MKKGEHETVLTHVDRIFVNKTLSCVNVNKELQATRDQWTRWYIVNKSFNIKVQNKTFAQVLTTGKLPNKRNKCVLCQGFKRNGDSKTITSPYHKYSKCVPLKCVQAKRNNQVYRHDNPLSNAGTGKLRLNSETQSNHCKK